MRRTKPECLIGKRSDDPDFTRLIAELDELPEVDRFAELDVLSFPRSGLALYLNQKTEVVSIFLHAHSDQDHARYEGQLPASLSFEDGPEDVARRLGMPAREGREKASNAPWARFDLNGFSIHIQYSSSSQIEMVTLISLSMARETLIRQPQASQRRPTPPESAAAIDAEQQGRPRHQLIGVAGTQI